MFLKISTINSDQGLPNEQIHAIDQDKFGRIWIAGPAGLACYNGNDIKIFDSRSGLECQGLRTLSVTKEGLIWIGTDRGLETMDINGNKVNWNFTFDWIFGIGESILVCDHCIWAGTSFGLLKLKQDTDSIQLELAEEFGLVADIISIEGDKILAVTGNYGLIEHDGINWKTVNEKLPVADMITCVSKTLDNFLLVGTLNGLYVLSYTYDIIEIFSLPDQSKKVTAIAVSGNEWWIAFGHLLVQLSYDMSEIKILDYDDIKSKINFLHIGNLGNIWIATNNNGLKKISCLRKSLQYVDISNHNSAFCIHEIPGTKKLLIGGDSFCTVIVPEMLLIPEKAKQIFNFPTIVWDTCLDPLNNKTTVFATESGLYVSKNKNTPVRYVDEKNKMTGPNRVLITRHAEIWLGTISGLFKITTQGVQEALNIFGNTFGYVYSLALGLDEKLWIGTLGQGLWQETEAGFVPIVSDLLSEKGNTYCIKPDKEGNILIIQEEKVILLDKNLTGRLILKEYPIAGWSAVWLDNRTIATGSNDGIIIIDIEKETIVQRINLHLSKADWQFTSSCALYYDGHEKLYCGLNSGLYQVDYKNIQQFNITPVIYTDEITWYSVIPEKNNKGFRIPVGKWSLSVSVYSAWFIDEKQVRYRFKMIGFDETWRPLTELPNTRYNSLPSGKYELQCQAYTALTGFGETKTLLKFTVYSPLTKLGLQPVIDSMGAAVYHMFNSGRRNRLLLKKNEELETEITERKLIELELKRYKEELEVIVEHRTKDLIIQKEKAESADKMKSVFLAHMSHEIRTPLGVVIGMNHLMQKTTIDADQADYLKIIDSSAHHLLQVINNILDIAKIESGKIELEQIPFSISTMLEELSGFVQLNMRDKPVEFIIENRVQNTNYLLGDALRIKQVLINLISNAFKFTEEGTVKLSINQQSYPNFEEISFAVSDTGIGMTEKQMEHLFEAFNQADSGISRKYGGTGLGLNISYKFIELMGGKLKVKSEFNKGSTLYFAVPLKPSNEWILPEAEKIDEESLNKYPSGFDKIRSAKILIAEDEVLNQFILRKVLEAEGFVITIANNGNECISLLEKNNDYDIILMDIQMPEMDGFATTQYIRNSMRHKDVKIIGVSANAFSETKQQILSDGMNDFLSKPVNMNELFAMLVKWINPAVN
jgi:signal transduction histidine kinase/CheY-like chemotaxis protein/ligand-binding sensor domain-containing protein